MPTKIQVICKCGNCNHEGTLDEFTPEYDGEYSERLQCMKWEWFDITCPKCGVKDKILEREG